MKNTSTPSSSSSATAKQAAAVAAFEDLSPDELVAIIKKKSEVIDAQQKRIATLEEYLRLERARRFGPSSEKHPGQGELALGTEGTEDQSAANEADAQKALEELNDMNDTAPAKKRGRRGLSKNLPRHQIRIDLSDEEIAGAIDTFYTLVKEELDIQPAKARVIEYLQEKAVFVDHSVDKHIESERRVVSAPLPKHPLNKCIASIGLLTYLIVAKFCDGLSLYHLEKMIKRYGGDITRTSLIHWTIRLGDVLQPLVDLAQSHQCAHHYIQMDETRLKVLKEVNKSPHSEKWMWVMKGGPPDKPAVVFHYARLARRRCPLAC
jgi:transposase